MIFGWGGGKAKDHGPAVLQVCRSCGRQGHLHYFTVTKWFRLYFIPIIPYNTRHFLACPVCTAGTELTSTVERERVQALASTTKALGSGQAAPATYGEQQHLSPGPAPVSTPLPPAPPIGPPDERANQSRVGKSWSA